MIGVEVDYPLGATILKKKFSKINPGQIAAKKKRNKFGSNIMFIQNCEISLCLSPLLVLSFFLSQMIQWQGLSQAAPLRQSRTAIGIVPLKNGQGDNNCPLQNLGKKLERKHTRRDLFQYRNCKLKQNVESIFYRTCKVHSKVTFQSRSTAIFVENLRRGFWFFARSRSREVHKNTKNTAKFGTNLIKYMSVQHIWNLFQL